MTKDQLINQIAEKTGIDKLTATIFVEALKKTIRQSMVDGENIYLRGFGTFLLKKRAAKTGRNIYKGTSIKIPAHYIPAFKPSKEFTNAIIYYLTFKLKYLRIC